MARNWEGGGEGVPASGGTLDSNQLHGSGVGVVQLLCLILADGSSKATWYGGERSWKAGAQYPRPEL